MIELHLPQRFAVARHLGLIALVVQCLGCAHKDLPPVPPVDYSKCDEIRLNVAKVTFVDARGEHTVAGDISDKAPTPPVEALREMVQRRLKAVGSGGTAKVTVLAASIQHAPVSTLIGHCDLRIDISSPTSNTAGLAVARVNHRLYTGNAPPESPTALNNMTTMLTRDMNGAMEDQIRHILGDWLVDASGLPIRNGVSATALTTPSFSKVQAANTQTVQSLSMPRQEEKTAVKLSQQPVAQRVKQEQDATPDAVFPIGEEPTAAPPATTKAVSKGVSPPPQFLQLPPRTAP